MTEYARIPFVEFRGFLEAALELGITLDDGIRELLDNSFDSGASNIRVWVEPCDHDEHGKGLRITVADDGRGIPESITADDGIERSGISYVLSFGGKQPRRMEIQGKTRLIGRFGWGLSATVSCLARERGRAQVWSRTEGEREWRVTNWDYQDILADD